MVRKSRKMALNGLPNMFDWKYDFYGEVGLCFFLPLKRAILIFPEMCTVMPLAHIYDLEGLYYVYEDLCCSLDSPIQVESSDLIAQAAKHMGITVLSLPRKLFKPVADFAICCHSKLLEKAKKDSEKYWLNRMQELEYLKTIPNSIK